MKRRDVYLLIFILVLFGLALWWVVPFNTKLLGENGRLNLGLDLRGGSYLVYQADLTELGPNEDPDQVMEGIKKAIEQRIDVMGLSQPVVQVRQQAGEYGIVIQLPGASEEQTKEVEGKMVALITFMEQDETGNWTPLKGTVNGTELTLSSRFFKQNTKVSLDDLGNPVLQFEWDETGIELCKQIGDRLLNKPLGIFLGDEPIKGEDGSPIAPIVRANLEDCNVIEGLSLRDAQELSDLLNAGRIPVPLGKWEGEGDSRVFEPNVPLSVRTVDATLGADSIQKSMIAAGIGIILLLLFMILYYRLPGLIACLSLGIYGIFLLAIFALLPITLTLPGIAAAIISLGMAVDANVLIFERMKEELRAGRTLNAAVEAGFNRAWTAIRDSNITTFIACGVLLWLGTRMGASMVSSFAMTLFIGVALSMFTAIIVSRTFLRLTAGSNLVTNPTAYGVKA